VKRVNCSTKAHGRNKLALFRGELLASNQTVVWTKTIAVLEDNALWDSDYPTTIQGRGGVESILVSYTCFSHSAACLATVTDD
jgi:hypothetical protein